jgi:glycosyltransferase involved in cell wall biosynthesis
MNTSETNNFIALIPAYNESSCISEVIAATKLSLDVLVIDDGSSDDTAEQARQAGAKVLSQGKNQGKGVALRAGFAYALEGENQAVITLDADGQHDPVEIPKFLRAFQEKRPNLIIGQRDFSQMPPIRRLANSIGQWSFSWALGQHVPDNQSGYRLIDHTMMRAMLNSKEAGFEFEVDMIVTCAILGLNISWVPIQTIYRGESSHIHAYDHIVNYFRILYHTRRRIAQSR